MVIDGPILGFGIYTMIIFFMLIPMQFISKYYLMVKKISSIKSEFFAPYR